MRQCLSYVKSYYFEIRISTKKFGNNGINKDMLTFIFLLRWE